MQMNWFQERMARWATALVAVTAATALLVGAGAEATTAGLVFLVLVVWFATLSGYLLSLYVALVCAGAFDFYFLPPLHTFRIVGIQQWVALASFVASSIVVSRVAEMARRQALKAEQRSMDLERLYALSQQMMLYEDAERLLNALPRQIEVVFSLNGVVLYVCETEQFHTSAHDLPLGIRGRLQAAVEGPHVGIEQAGDFTVMPLLLGLQPVGALGLRPASLSREVATAVSAQVAIAVARSLAIAETARMEAAREAERLRTALTDSLTHELRTPLTSIRAAATTLVGTDGLDEESRKDLAIIIDEESARLDLLIGEAVEMAEIDANLVQIHAAPHLARTFMEQALEVSRKNLGAHRVTIDAEDDDRPACFDAHLLGRVLRHLLENAAAHTPTGTTVRLTSRQTQTLLEFSVEDNGPGIEAKDLPHIFEKFYRGKRRPGMRKGSGMGLAIARAILIAHGGGIEATSPPGKGAQFRFWVPLVAQDADGKQTSSNNPG